MTPKEEKRQPDDLLPCPFCGSDDLVRFPSDDTEIINCQKCWGSGPDCRSDLPHEVTQKWNTRTHGQWRPIATAPKDGRVLTWSTQIISAADCIDGSVHPDAGDYYLIDYWMPLPDAPTDDEPDIAVIE